MQLDHLYIQPRFNGPPGMANGGIACGSLAGGDLATAFEVRLHAPVPLGRRLAVRHDAGARVLEDAGELVATARVVDGSGPALAVPESASEQEAVLAAERSSCRTAPIFPDCFVCGVARAAGDGLRIFAGKVQDRDVWAAPWTPDAAVAAEVVWGALDCPSGFAAVEHAIAGGALPRGSVAVLGQMSARIAVLPDIGVEHRIVAWPIAVAGRKLTAGSALLSPAGAVLAAATATWIVIAAEGVRR